MGTSQSSSGSPSNVPFVPPWVPDVSEPGDESNDGANNGEQDTAVAPTGRWRGSRLSLGKFAQSGDSVDMRSGIGHYVSGLGGALSGTRRFGGTIKTADRLHGALSGLARKQPIEPSSPLDPALLKDRTVREVLDAVIEAVRPVDGTQDSEASRSSINDALSDLLERFPEADLFQLSQEHREFAIERFVAYDVYRRFNLDVGGAIKGKAPNATVALSRLGEAKDYIRETVATSFQQLRNAGQRLLSDIVTQVINKSLRGALMIFEEYVI